MVIVVVVPVAGDVMPDVSSLNVRDGICNNSSRNCQTAAFTAVSSMT